MCDLETSAALRGLRQIAPDVVLVGARRIDPDDERFLFGAERALIATSASRRRHEFATGRVLLRSLLGRDVPIGAGADRRPRLPGDVVASLAHDDRMVVAAAARRSDAIAIGVDIEAYSDLEPAVASLIVRTDDEVNDPLEAFVLKEAAFKAWSNAGGRMLDHHDVRISTDRERDVFRAIVEPDNVVLTGRFTTAAESCIALVVVAVPGSPLDRWP